MMRCLSWSAHDLEELAQFVMRTCRAPVFALHRLADLETSGRTTNYKQSASCSPEGTQTAVHQPCIGRITPLEATANTADCMHAYGQADHQCEVFLQILALGNRSLAVLCCCCPI